MANNYLISLLYPVISSLGGLVGWPYFLWHLKSRGRGESFLPRLGLRLPPSPPPAGAPRVWVHGVSVGEVLAALPLIKELQTLLPHAAVIVTTGTETGQAVARRQLIPLGAYVCYFPLDLPWAVARYLDFLKPDLFIALDSEIWPNFLSQAHRRGIPLALANARLSDQSFRRFIKYRRYSIDLLKLFGAVAAGSTLDYERLRHLGVSPARLHFTGNLKIDRLLQDRDPEALEDLAARLNLPGPPVLLAASTHPGEEEVVLEAYEKLRAPYPALVLLLAPRHPERAPELARMLQNRGLPFHLFSRLKADGKTRDHPVVIIDTIGDLFTLYGLADAAFVGGSLVPHGGQNILEAAAWGRAPIYGPNMENFRWAYAILEEAGAGIMVHDAPSLYAAVRRLLDAPQTATALGARAQAALSRHQGAARRQAELMVRLLGKGGRD